MANLSSEPTTLAYKMCLHRLKYIRSSCLNLKCLFVEYGISINSVFRDFDLNYQTYGISPNLNFSENFFTQIIIKSVIHQFCI